MIGLLPPWALTNPQPAFLESESGSVLEQTAKMYAKVNELVNAYNSFVQNINKEMEEFLKADAESKEQHMSAIRQEYQDFIDIINLKVLDLEKEINDAEKYMKDNLEESISATINDLEGTGFITDELKALYNEILHSLNVLDSRITNLSTLTEGSTTGDAELMDARLDYLGVIHENLGNHIRQIYKDMITFTGYSKYPIKYGNVKSSFTPVLTDSKQFLYVIIDTKSISENVVVKDYDTSIGSLLAYSTLYDDDGNIVYDSNGWRELAANDIVAKPYSEWEQSYPSTRYIGTTFMFNDYNGEPVVELPIDCVTVVSKSFITDLNTKLTNVERNFTGDLLQFTGYSKHQLRYGNVMGYMNPTYTNYKQFLHVIIDTKSISENVVVKDFNSDIGNPVAYLTAYDDDGNALFHGEWIDVSIGTIVCKPYTNYETAFPNTRYMGVTFMMKNNGETVLEIPTDCITVVNNTFYNDINKRLLKLEDEKNIVCIVDKNGSGDYTTISDAINNTKQGDTILIMPGIYEEQVKMFGKERYLVGLNKETTIIRRTETLYGEEPVQACIGGLYNLTIIAGYGYEPVENDDITRCYALHVEYAQNEPYTLFVENCNLISTGCHAVGMGVRYNESVIFKNCLMETKAKTVHSSYYNNNYVGCGLFIHNDASGSNKGNDGFVSVENCELKGVRSALALQSQNNGNELKLRFVNNLLWSTENGKTNALFLRNSPIEGHICGSDLVLDGVSFGNNIDELNA